MRRTIILAVAAAACVLEGAVAFSIADHVSFWLACYWAVGTATTAGSDVALRSAAARVVTVAVELTAIPLLGATFASLTALHVHRHIRDHVDRALAARPAEDHKEKLPMTRTTPFRAGGSPRGIPALTAAAPVTYLADISEFEPSVADAVYLAWSPAIVIRAAYGDEHDDQAWYGGQRRALLHKLGAKFVGIYQYLVSGQDGAAQARAFHALVGAIRPGEVLIADFEEGDHAMLTAWYNQMLSMYGQGIAPYLWTYTGLDFGQAAGALPVQWIADYSSAEPSTPHTLWQFTSAYQVPGVGSCDASLFHGSIDQLAALAFPQTAPKPAPQPASWQYGPPLNLTARPGASSVLVERCDAPAGAPAPVDHYEISVFTGSYPSAATLVPSYPRYMKAAPEQFGGLEAIPSGEHMTLRAVAYGPAGTHAGQYADVQFQMP